MWACCWCCRIRSRSGSKSELRHNNSNRLTRRSVCPALCLPITSSVINGRNLSTTSAEGSLDHQSSREALTRFLQAHRVGGVASFHTSPSRKDSQTSRAVHLPALSPKAEFTARPLLPQQIPARCRSLRLLSWVGFFFSFFGPKGAKD